MLIINEKLKTKNEIKNQTRKNKKLKKEKRKRMNNLLFIPYFSNMPCTSRIFTIEVC